MTGWTQFTARFEEKRHADALVEDAEACPERTSYSETFEDIARVRILGYHKHDEALRLLESAGPIEAVLVADFNDTTDSGEVTVYQPNRQAGFEKSVGGASCPEASRWDFRFEVGGLVETGERAGNDFSLEQQYGDANREVVPLDEMERIADETLEMLKTEARVESEEYRNA